MRCRGAASGESAGRHLKRRLHLLVTTLVASCAAFAASLDPGELPSEPAPLASRSLLVDLAQAGSRLVAVGERGHVLLSDNRGQTWRQAKSVPTQNLLNAVCFSDEKHGIAVGHDEIVLTTADAGETWARKHYAPDAQQPLLDVLCNGQDAIAVGAYSVYFTSKDLGETWTEHKFSATAGSEPSRPSSAASGGSQGPPSLAARSPESKPAAVPPATPPSSDEGIDSELSSDYHLNRIVAASGSRLYIAAEAGHLYRSDDAGASWQELPSPYEGSFFGILPLNADSLLAYGLRGHLYRSDNAGATWREITTHTQAMLNDAVRLPGGGVAVVGLSGVVLTSGNDGEQFTVTQQNDRKGLSAVLPSGTTELITVGEAGVKLIVIGSGG